MAKPSNTSIAATTSRRRVLQSFGYFTAAGVTVAIPKTPAQAAPLRAEPTDKGKRLLGILALYREAWRQGPLSDETSVFLEEAKAVAREIAATPVHTMADVIDRAIVMAWLMEHADHWYDRDEAGGFDPLLGPLVQLGGVSLDMCSDYAEALAA
jgi:hypothetical protein